MAEDVKIRAEGNLVPVPAGPRRHRRPAACSDPDASSTKALFNPLALTQRTAMYRLYVLPRTDRLRSSTKSRKTKPREADGTSPGDGGHLRRPDSFESHATLLRSVHGRQWPPCRTASALLHTLVTSPMRNIRPSDRGPDSRQDQGQIVAKVVRKCTDGDRHRPLLRRLRRRARSSRHIEPDEEGAVVSSLDLDQDGMVVHGPLLEEFEKYLCVRNALRPSGGSLEREGRWGNRWEVHFMMTVWNESPIMAGQRNGDRVRVLGGRVPTVHDERALTRHEVGTWVA
ncbi:hypothetical protein FB45DRAFT_878935 [Roridomyces roridus]|uniref:Uncharacterized protein n=1 Tax=Roridomyces roridus TaxID=1738132 RepID=A0AAD7B0T7_9AGAR|nr:hypothetical protein FB45DRAFT_878935 [Roridomyces roridus]